jgi:hypothetical protein
VAANLGKLLGKSRVNEAIEGGGTVLELRFDELHLALVYLGLRTFRLAGGGALKLGSRLTPSRDGAGYDVLVDIAAEPVTPLDETHDDDPESSRTSPGSADHGATFEALVTLLHAAGASLETDQTGAPAVRASLRIPLGP